MSPSLLLGVRVLAWRLRRVAAAVLVVLAACLVARQAAPPPAPTTDVVVAARDLTAGQVLAQDDLRTVRLAVGLVPAGAVGRVAALEGRWAVVDVPAGLPLVDGVLDADRFGIRAPAGTVAVPIRLADAAVAALLRPGDRIDLVAPGSTLVEPGDQAPLPTVLARAALVLEVSHDDPAGDGGLLGGGAATADPLVVVAVAVDEGHQLASAVGGSLGAVLVQGSGTGGLP